MHDENQFRHLDTVPESKPEQNKPEKQPRNVWGYVLTVLITATLTFILTAGVAIAVVSFAGNANLINFGNDKNTLSFVDPDDPVNKAALDKLQRIYELVDGEFVDDLTDAELIDAMARGLLAELDNPYTFYLSAEQNQLIKESFAGNYSGIGAMVAINRDGQAEVTELTAGGPAIEAGVKLGDVFLEVDGKPMTEINDVTELAALVRGEEGTKVEIKFYRTSTKETLDLSIERRPISSTTVVARILENGIGYIQIREFNTGVSEKFLSAVKGLQNEGATQLVIDLRNNGGGLANEVLDMLDQMLPAVEMTRFAGRRNGAPFTDIKMSDANSMVPADMRYAILVNNMTASASELMAGSLRDHGLARLIGEQSYGKGSGTITVELSDGSAVQLTNFLYYLPKGDNIEEKGLTPDEIVSLTEDAKSEPLALLDPADDTQLQAAIAWLRSLRSARPAA
ncbi:MAG: S41 family peptidase [Ruminococcaceae bacterium]|nr:S41 family peptidase [Oscillospiraceae bacterium]